MRKLNVYNSQVHKSKKIRKCCICGREIKIGETYAKTYHKPYLDLCRYHFKIKEGEKE